MIRNLHVKAFFSNYDKLPFSRCMKRIYHLFSQNPATNTENSAQSRSEHIFMESTLFVYNINSQ